MSAETEPCIRPYRREEGTFPSSDGFHNAFYTVDAPYTAPKGIVLLVHGMNECFSRYEDSGFVDRLANAGYVVCGCDLPGHGRSVNEGEKRGHIADYRHMTEDVHRMALEIRKKYRYLPLIAFGHSLGSFVLRDLMKTHGDDADGIVLCGSVGANMSVGAAKVLSGFLSVFGKKHRSPLMRAAMFSFLSSRLGGKAKTSIGWINSLEEKTALLIGNELYDFPLTAGGYGQVFRLISSITGERVTEDTTKSAAVFLMSGEDDPVGDMGNGIPELYDEYFEYGIDPLEKKLYPGCRHEIMNDRCADEMTEDLIAFCDDVVSSVIAFRTAGYATNE